MQSFSINRTKSEAPVIAIFAVFGLIISLVFYPTILWYSFLAFPLLALAFMFFKKYELGLLSRKCFLITDDEGIRYCFHQLQQPRKLRWDQVEKVNFQMYEINLRLKVSGQVISIQIAYLEDPEDYARLKKIVGSYCETM
jgi:hypothetical protein